ncbi:phosphoribosylamine--glycine ligase [Blattabacterium cuenoti]|uniref:phosphoribosylamine--glycine ligase n=1 Tax=Blattabacterium cuenoti TaxID=1653831 RepID=UPI00163D2998|nr:phosphoribosylamine--glycine ligase [Blattabacterium cuenoti]
MKILIIGSGGREHAIGKKLLKDNPNIHLYFYPGNGGTKLIGENIEGDYSVLDLSFFSKKNNIDLTIVGSEFILMKEIVDLFKFYKLNIVGPHYLAARLEGDRIFAKSFMKKYGIRNPKYEEFDSYDKAINFLEKNIINSLVIKTNGLASGKGVILTHNKNEAKQALKTIMIKKKFGDSGNKVIIEEFLQGNEVSIISIFNNKEIIPFLSSKDYKKIEDNDKGLNTGGMGAIVPNPYMNDYNWIDFQKNILEPTLEGIMSEKLNFFGFLYFGLIISNNKIYLLEYNTRMGDPETQSLLPLMKSNFFKLLMNAFNGEKINILWKNYCSCCVVLSSKGYPEKYSKGNVIKGINLIEEPFYIAGADKKNDKWITSGGRVLNIIGISSSIKEARNIAYKKIEKIQFNDLYYRKDIGLF